MQAAEEDAVARYTHNAYLELEQQLNRRYEYLAGEVFAMVGGTEFHAMISSNTLVALASRLRDRPCRVYGSDMKLHIARHDKFCYPDVMVLCEAGKRHSLYVEEPSLIVEVLSESTESYDRGLKFEHYRDIESLQYYLLLSQRRLHAELFTRKDASHWSLHDIDGEDAQVALPSLAIEMPLAEIYRDVDLIGEEARPPSELID